MMLQKNLLPYLDKIFDSLWEYYYKHVPYAPQIEKHLRQRGDEWVQDHVAFRSLPGHHTGMNVIKDIFTLFGYMPQDEYKFSSKKLKAVWLSPPPNPNSDSPWPKIFISELEPEGFSSDFRRQLERLNREVEGSPLAVIKQLAEQFRDGDQEAASRIVEEVTTYFKSGPSWSRPSKQHYELLRSESSYAGWTYLFGHSINHFTVSMNHISSYKSIEQLGHDLEATLKIPMNHVGGLVKGSKDVYLEQIATLACDMRVAFQEGIWTVPYGFVEFAQRHPIGNELFQGFVADNADKIFESTDVDANNDSEL